MVTKCPRTSDDWKQFAAKVSSRWNFHHTLGTIDGKHVAIRCPKNDGSSAGPKSMERCKVMVAVAEEAHAEEVEAVAVVAVAEVAEADVAEADVAEAGFS